MIYLLQKEVYLKLYRHFLRLSNIIFTKYMVFYREKDLHLVSDPGGAVLSRLSGTYHGMTEGRRDIPAV